MNYIFDGSYAGFLCCVFNYFSRQDEDPNALLVDGKDALQSSFFDTNETIMTDDSQAKRVQKGLESKLGKSIAKDFFRVFLSEDPKAWLSSFIIISKIFKNQPDILNNFGDKDVLYFSQTLKKVSRERHRMKAFIRFNKSNDGLFFAIIEPDFNVLPLIVDFFKNRYADQKWLIYDVKRNYGLIYDTINITEVKLSTNQTNSLIKTPTITLDEKDSHYQNLWNRYYKSTNIEAKRNIKLHLQHVPKRYWKYLPEKN